MSIVFRPARENELEQAETLVVRSINDLTVRHGFGPLASLRAPKFQTFSCRDDPDGLWIAEEAAQILGFAFSWVCDGLWFLAELFVAPEHQGRGIGNALLERTLHHAEKAKASHRALITFTFNTVSQGLYIRHGLLPRLPLYVVSKSPDGLPRGQPPRTELRSAPFENGTSLLDHLARIDARALGVSRVKHHCYLIADGAMRGFLFYREAECAGYAYIGPDGQIGPLAVAQPGLMADAFRLAATLAAHDGSTLASAFVPGTSAALPVAIEQGWRIRFPMVLMSTRDFGDWQSYLPRNPGFM